MSRVCLEPGCGATVSRGSKTGYCRTCSSRRVCARMNADPAIKAKAKATMSGWTREQRFAKVRHLLGREIPPQEAAERSRRGHELVAMMRADPEIAKRRLSPEVRKRAGAKRTATMLAWCPIEYRDAYMRLVNRHKIAAADARAMIERQIETDLERYQRTGKLQASGVSS